MGGGEADGAAHFQQGNTHVRACVYGPREPSKRGRAQLGTERCTINCEVCRLCGMCWRVFDLRCVSSQYSMAAFSTGERKAPLKRDRRSMEIGLILRRTFEAVIQTERFPHSQIDIYVTVLTAVRDCALHKSVPLTPALCRMVVLAVLQSMPSL
jgi:exosome complex component RRP41